MKKFLTLFLIINSCACKKNSFCTSTPVTLVTTYTFSSGGNNFSLQGSGLSLANQGSLIMKSTTANGCIFPSPYTINNVNFSSISLFIYIDYPIVSTCNPPSASYRGEAILHAIS